MASKPPTETNAQPDTRTAAAQAYETARERTRAAVDAVTDRAEDYTQRAAESLETYPVAAVIGGFALGALVAAALPRTEREDELFGEAGQRLTGAARDVARTAFDAGKTQVDEIRSTAAQRIGEAVAGAVGGPKA